MGFLNNITAVVKNLLLLNLVFFVASWAFQSGMGVELNTYLALHHVDSTHFGVWQFVTYMFLHANIEHIFFNMFSLLMFGSLIEIRVGAKKFLTYYLLCGIGAGLIQIGTYVIEVNQFTETVDAIMTDPSTENIQRFINGKGQPFSQESDMMEAAFVKSYNEAVGGKKYAEAVGLVRTFLSDYQQLYIDSHCTVGASGAVFGLLLAVAFLFPNLEMFLFFIPIPIKAKYFVAVYAVIELFFGVAGFRFDNIAHWAHLGGMVFGLVLLMYWKKRGEI